MLFSTPRAIFLAILLPLATQAQTKDTPGDLFGPATKGQISSLPDAIKKQAVSGKATLYADFKNAVDGEVRVYLLNPSPDPVILESQDGDIYSKREAFATDGVWRRCDSHIFSDCGNSYGIRTVPEGEFISWAQPLDSSGGTKSRIRFRLFQDTANNLVSNEGEATILAEEIHRCRYDILAMRTAPFDDVVALATGAVTLQEDPHQWQDPVLVAVNALERFTRNEKVIEALKLVQERARVAELDVGSRETKNPSLHLHRYEAALDILGNRRLYYPGSGEAWFHLEGQFRDKTNPWRGVILQWMLNQPYNGGEVLHPLLESALADPGHGQLVVALNGLSKAYSKEETRRRLKSAMANLDYPAHARLAARDTYELTFANPFIELKVDPGSFSNEGLDPFGPTASIKKLEPLKGLTVTNISPQRVRLPCKDLRQLLIVRVTLNNGQEFSNVAHPRTPSSTDEVVLEPGQSLHAGEVKWWDLVKLPHPFPEGEFTLSVAFATPGLWDPPARGGSSFRLDGKALE